MGLNRWVGDACGDDVMGPQAEAGMCDFNAG